MTSTPAPFALSVAQVRLLQRISFRPESWTRVSRRNFRTLDALIRRGIVTDDRPSPRHTVRYAKLVDSRRAVG